MAIVVSGPVLLWSEVIGLRKVYVSSFYASNQTTEDAYK